MIKEYLNNPDLSIVQIAEEMNFTTLSYFSRYVTKHLGMSPKAYRESLVPR
jgi:AraC-like DNA-binding protein